MVQQGILAVVAYVQRTKAGMLSVLITSNGEVIMNQQLPQKLGNYSYQIISTILGIDRSVLESTLMPIEVISTGLADVIVPVPNGYLDRIKPDDVRIASFCKSHNVIGFHVFELCKSDSLFTASWS